MKIFNKKQFLELSRKSGEPFISLYISVSRMSTDGYHSDKTNLKNQLAKADNILKDRYSLSNKEIESILAPAKELLIDQEFWKFNSSMLAIFLSSGKMDLVQLPQEVKKDICFIGHKPYLLPLIPELNDNGHYYLLLLNLEHIRLYGVTRNVIQEIELNPEEVALSMTDEEERSENKDSLQGQGNVGKAGAMMHGHGKGSDEEKKVTILNYFHRMTNMLEPILNTNPLPLYIAGVEYLGPLFREASKYNHLMEGQVIGAFSEKDIATLHQKSWDIAEPHFLEERIRRNNNFEALQAKNLAIAKHSQTLIKAALTGAVETLMINRDHDYMFGKYDPDKHELILSENQGQDDHCLIDEASTKVIDFGGKVFIVEPAFMPVENEVVGTLRYEI